MITCVSERSGIASSGMLRTAKIPANVSPSVASRTMNLFRNEKSIIARNMDRYASCLSGVVLGVGDAVSALSLGAGIRVIPQIGHLPGWLYFIVACSGIGQTYAVGVGSNVGIVDSFGGCR